MQGGDAAAESPAVMESESPDAPANAAVAEDLARVAPAALSAAIEAIPSPAFVVRMPATILKANTRGQALLAADHERVIGSIRSNAPPPRGPVRFPVDAAPEHIVLVLPDLQGDARSRLAAVSRRWGLTPRQSAVLDLVAQGESNRTVAGRLGCSEKTVELHVSALLAKTRCVSRSQLVASFWTDRG